MHKLVKIVAVWTLLGAPLMACGSAGADPQGADSQGSQVAALATGEDDVPSLRCEARTLAGRLDATLVVQPSSSDPTRGLALLRKYYLLDGQSFLVGRWDVTSTNDGAEVRDAAGLFALTANENGWRLEALNAFGLPVHLDMQCTSEATR